MSVPTRDIIVIPSGTIMIVGSYACHYVRSVVSGDESDKNRTRFIIKNLQHSFPEFRSASTGYSEYLAFLSL